jgi:deoxycytidine triphosphate deaminase
MTEQASQQDTPSNASRGFPFSSAHILTDIQIREEVERIGLIGGEYRPESARYASYELHASEYVEKLVYDQEVTGHVEMPTNENEIVLEPGITVKVYTAETINLPANMLALVIALGQLFAAGLAAGSTYVDPGSRGEIYISLTNLTGRSVRIPVGCPIARAMFFILGSPVETLHGGPKSRRRIRLRVAPPQSGPEPSKIQRSDVATRLVWHKFALYILLGLFVGLAWATAARSLGNNFLDIVAGSTLPKAVRLVIPPLILGAFAFIAKDLRVTVKQVLRATLKRFFDWLKDFSE